MSLTVLAVVLSIASSPTLQDTIIVRADQPPTWGRTTVREAAVIGSLDGPSEYTFGLIIAVSLGLDSTIYVSDIQAPIIRRYSLSGDHLGDIGGEGQGPGEYNQILGTEILPDGRLAVWDPRNVRVSLYEPNGTFDTSFNVQSGLFSADVFQSDGEGNVYVRTTLDRGAAPGEEWNFAWMRISPDGSVLDTIPTPKSNSTPSYSLSTVEGYRRPFPTQTLNTMSSAGYLVWGRTDEYAIHRTLSDGRILRIERPYDPVQIGGGERAQWEAFSDYFEGLGTGGGRKFTRPAIPRTKPPFRWIFTDDDGRIWVSVYAPAHEVELTAEYIAEREGRPLYRWREAPEWDVFDPRGTYLGHVVMPTNSYPSVVRGNIIVATRLGEFNEPYVVVLSLETAR